MDFGRRPLRQTIACVFLLAVFGCQTAKGSSRVTISSYKELGAFFQQYGYTFATWRTGLRAVPRAYIAEVPQRWSGIADQVSLQTKKEIFYSAMLPVVLRANELIMKDRQRAEPIAMQIVTGVPISDDDRTFLRELAARYGMDLSSGAIDDKVLVGELLLRVDLIPPSLALAQAAYESAYATSRFAGLGNALYGQQAAGGKGMNPLERSVQPEQYRIAAFESPLASTLAYAANLNTKKAYGKFRARRAEFRRNGKFPDGAELALTLTAYSERGEKYTHEIANVIRNLRLAQADLAFLRDMDPIYLFPKKLE